jgi:hypothetical protein
MKMEKRKTYTKVAKEAKNPIRIFVTFASLV